MKNRINPKVLKGQDKLNRMLDLMGKMTTLNESTSLSELELIKKGPNGVVYGIVRENHDYFIKTSTRTNGEFYANDFNYIGGLQNKSTEKYTSYAEALKHLNIKFDMLNESYGIKSNVNIFESDGVAFGGGVGFGFVLEDEDEEESKELISDDKSVLKVDVPKSETPEAPVEDEVADEDPEVDMGGDIASMDFNDDTSSEDEGVDGEEGDETTKKIQKLTGKITQMLRDMDSPDSELEKYVINSLISAMHLDEMDEGDKEDIISKIEGEEEEGEESDDTSLEDDKTSEEPKEVEIPEEPSNELSETKEDFITLNGKKYKRVEESKTYSKKNILNSFRKTIKESRYVCEECMGKGCSTCAEQDANESYMYEDEYEGFKDGRKKIDFAEPYGKINKKDFEELRRGKRKPLEEDEMLGFMDTDTINFDSDFDDIPNKFDMDNNNDGRIDRASYGDEDFIELDLDFLMNDAPVKEPGIKKPVTKPREGEKWRTIQRPKVMPKPKAGDDTIKPSHRRRGMF